MRAADRAKEQRSADKWNKKDLHARVPIVTRKIVRMRRIAGSVGASCLSLRVLGNVTTIKFIQGKDWESEHRSKVK